jgi:hypothetical protein
MTSMLKISLMTLAIGAAFHSANSNATVGQHEAITSAVNYCQAFTPGVSNTIRNRVIGSENVGTAPIAVACDLPVQVSDNDIATDPSLKFAFIVLSNGGTADVSISCTLLTGSPGLSTGDAYTATQTVVVPAGGINAVNFTSTDNPNAGATNLGNILAGVNCMLPPHTSITATDIGWDEDDGVGN